MSYSKHPGITCFSIAAYILLATGAKSAFAIDKQEASVQVENKTDKEIEFVTVAHKYSDNYKDAKTWGNLPKGQGTKEPLTVRYHTGFGATGQDWWLVAWKYKGEPKIYFSAPNNLRSIIDGLEKGVIGLLPELGKAGGAAVGGGVGATIGGPAAEKIGSLLLNTESTAGYKSHILRERDAKQTTRIVLEPNRVIIMSISGNNSIPVNSKDAK